MRSIFWKIFLAFWGVMLAVVTVTTVLSLNIGSRWAEESGSADRWKTMDSAMDVFEKDGIEALKDWVLDLTHLPPGLTIYVIDEDGREMLDREVLDFRGGRISDDQKAKVRVAGPRGSFDLEESDGTKYIAFMGRAKPQILGVLAVPEIRQTVIPIALLASALACFLLSKYLTRPIEQIVGAAQELERGDFSQRAGVRAGRSDEIGVLGRQFNAMAEQIERNEITRKDLFRNLSHELRTPLARIQLAIELARREPTSVADYLDRIGNETVLLENMTQQMLALARMQYSVVGKAEEIDVVEIVSLVAEDARFEGTQDNKQIAWEPPDESLSVRGDRDLFRSAVENVVRNAIQYTPVDSTIEIEALSIGDRLGLTVSDQGSGVSDAKIGDIFEPFHRADSEIAGVGIGLAITKQVITAMGGTVSAKNLGEHGFQIAMTIPRSPA